MYKNLGALRHRWRERQQNTIIWAQTEMEWHAVPWQTRLSRELNDFGNPSKKHTMYW